MIYSKQYSLLYSTHNPCSSTILNTMWYAILITAFKTIINTIHIAMINAVHNLLPNTMHDTIIYAIFNPTLNKLLNHYSALKTLLNTSMLLIIYIHVLSVLVWFNHESIKRDALL